MDVEKKISEYFKKQELDWLKEHRAKKAVEVANEEREKLKELHYMHCPKCGQKMETVMMETIEIDKCPDCLGIYFDNLELEELFKIEHSKRKSFLHGIFGLK